MAERKVLNKYYPPNFDPSFITKKKTVRLPEEEVANQGGSGQHKVRLMAPFSMRCETCGGYIYKGTKFNARKETARGEVYFTIKIYRFYIRCPTCSSEITFKTDPKNTDYVAEMGATRNFEPWREDKFETEEKQLQRELDEFHNPMKGLENRTLASKREMEIMEALDDLRTRNAKLERASNSLSNKELEDLKEEEEDEKLAKEIFGKKKARLDTEEVDDEVELSKDELDKHLKKLKGISAIKNGIKKDEPKSTNTHLGVIKKKVQSNTLLDLGDYSDSD